MKNNKGLWIVGGIFALYWFLENYSLTVSSTSDTLNSALNLPVGVPLKNIIFNTPGTPNGLVRVYLAPKNESRIIG